MTPTFTPHDITLLVIVYIVGTVMANGFVFLLHGTRVWRDVLLADAIVLAVYLIGGLLATLLMAWLG